MSIEASLGGETFFPGFLMHLAAFFVCFSIAESTRRSSRSAVVRKSGASLSNADRL